MIWASKFTFWKISVEYKKLTINTNCSWLTIFNVRCKIQYRFKKEKNSSTGHGEISKWLRDLYRYAKSLINSLSIMRSSTICTRIYTDYHICVLEKQFSVEPLSHADRWMVQRNIKTSRLIKLVFMKGRFKVRKEKFRIF